MGDGGLLPANCHTARTAKEIAGEHGCLAVCRYFLDCRIGVAGCLGHVHVTAGFAQICQFGVIRRPPSDSSGNLGRVFIRVQAGQKARFPGNHGRGHGGAAVHGVFFQAVAHTEAVNGD